MKKLILIFFILSVVFFGVYKIYDSGDISVKPVTKINIEKDFYTADIEIPEDSAKNYPEINTFVSNLIKDFDKNYGNFSKEDANVLGLSDGRKYELMVTTEVATTSKTVSYILEVYSYTGGAHGGTNIKVFTYDSRNQLVKEKDVFIDSNWRKVVAQKAKVYFKDKFTKEGYLNEDMLDSGTEPAIENFSTWYLKDDKIVFVFGQYQVGPYVLGIQEFEVPLADIKDLVSSKFADKTNNLLTKSSPIDKNLNKVLRVVDGDTIVVLVSDSEEKVRLIGVNTPETVDPRMKVECFGKEASDFLKNLLTGKEVKLESDPSQADRDKYSRLLRYVYLDDGTFVNKKIVEDGFGYEYTYNLPYKFQKEFKEAQKQAEVGKMGLWADGICGR